MSDFLFHPFLHSFALLCNELWRADKVKGLRYMEIYFCCNYRRRRCCSGSFVLLQMCSSVIWCENIRPDTFTEVEMDTEEKICLRSDFSWESPSSFCRPLWSSRLRLYCISVYFLLQKKKKNQSMTLSRSMRISLLFQIRLHHKRKCCLSWSVGRGTETRQVGRSKREEILKEAELHFSFFELCVISCYWFWLIIKYDVTWC